MALAKSLLRASNFMILDEPTNHLDIESRKVLAQALKRYTGSFVIISHDRSFVDMLVNKVWYTGGGGIEVHLGNYSDYIYRKGTRDGALVSGYAPKNTPEYAPTDSGDRAPAPGNEGRSDRSNTKERKRREADERNRIHRELRELKLDKIDKMDWNAATSAQIKSAMEMMEERIHEIEAEKAQLQALINDAELYNDKERSHEVTSSYAKLESALKELYERWELIASHLK